MPDAIAIFLIAVLLTAASARIAYADAPTTKSDLRASYCLAVKSALLSVPADVDDPEVQAQTGLMQAHARADIQTLTLYLAPRLHGLDEHAMSRAAHEGTDDLRRFNVTFKSCQSRCSGSDTACTAQCESSDPAVRRLRSCNDLSWLPQ